MKRVGGMGNGEPSYRPMVRERDAVLKTFALILILVVAATGQERESSATVTYVAAGQVYVDAGRKQGVVDAATAIVYRDSTIVTTLRLFATSSRSSSWLADSAIASVRVGDVVRFRSVAAASLEAPVTDSVPRAPTSSLLRTEYRRPSGPSDASPMDLVGRLGAQVVAIGYDDPTQNLLQTGLILSARARMRSLPLKFDLYTTLRDVSRGGARPFSSRSMASSRLYRAVVEYDDGRNIAAVGRMTILSAPTVGLLDGIMVARRWGEVTVGTGFGIQPNADLQGTDADRRRLIVFTSYQPSAWSSATASATYAKSWYRGTSEREMVNATGGVSLTDRLSLWTSTDVDLRVTEGGAHRFAPSLSLLLFTLSWRATDEISLSGGVDASRSVLPYSFARFIPDSMSDRTLRSGVSVSGSVLLPYRMSLSANVTPRTSAGAFNGDYAGSAALSAYDVLRTGVGLRLQGLLSHNEMSSGQGYGLSASLHALTIDWSARVQQVRYRLTTASSRTVGTTLGIDAMVPILPRLSWLVSLDLVRGFGSTSQSVYSEVSYRF